ncbi:MAG: c-type cytochrome biogenesis protein CcmI [Reyranellaceae bacterium]
MLAFALAALTALAIAAIAFPLLRRRAATPQRRAYNLAVYRDQLAEIERDRGRGVLDEAQATAARAEVERRLLAAGQQDDRPAGDSPSLRRGFFAAACALPLLALVWYFATGRPELPARPFAERDAGQERIENAERLLDDLQQRLNARPDDLQGWVLLGRTALRVGRFEQAAEALARAIVLAPERADLLSSYAEALILQNKGIVSPRAREALDSALGLDPADISAGFYRGLAEEQDGKPRAALERWLALEAAAPADAPWLGALQEEIARLAQASGIDPQSLRPDRKASAPPRGPTAQDVERMAEMTPAEREQAIRSMVDRLEARLKDAPEDAAGWQRLGRARLVLGEAEKAVAAFAEAARRLPQDVGALGDLAEAQLRLAGIDAPPSPEAIATLQRMLALQPDNPLALFYLARADAETGDRKAAREKLERLLAQIPAQAPQRAQIEALLRTLQD